MATYLHYLYITIDRFVYPCAGVHREVLSCSWPTVDFEYMIKNKEATDSAAVEFCLYFEQIADSPNFLRKLALEFV